MKQWLPLLLAACVAVFSSGCQQSSQPVDGPVQHLPDAPEVETIDPASALDEIYQEIEISGLEEASLRILEDKFFIKPDMVEEYYVRYSSGRFGLADVFILYPVEEFRADLREQLEQIKLMRAREFVDYDVYNAHQIAQNGQIFEQGGYLILLMLEDNEAAREIIDRYIPKN